MDELGEIFKGTIAKASDLTEDGRVDDLAELMLSDEVIKRADRLIEKADSPFDANASDNLVAGQRLVDALIHARGFDAPAARLNHDEIDRLVHMGGYRPISRGGSRVPQQSHIDNDTLYIGAGVDGAGLYFAIEDHNGFSNEITINHKAEVYAGDDGYVIRGVVSPSVRMCSLSQLNSGLHGGRTKR